MVTELSSEEQLQLLNKIERREKQWRTIAANERAKKAVENEQNCQTEDISELSGCSAAENCDREAIARAIQDGENTKDAIRKFLRLDLYH